MKTKSFFRQHGPFFIILLLFLMLSSAYAVLIPLGEAPDEPAHLSYARFIANKGRLPATPAERSEAGYRATWPPLYHVLAAVPLVLVSDAPPTRLKAVGDTPRRLIPTNGQTIAAFIHTDDEAWPWRGITLAWHLARFVSVLLSAGAVSVTYAIVWKLTHHRWPATGVAAVQAFLPQFLFIGSVVNDDSLLILLSGLVLLAMVHYTQRTTPPGIPHFLGLGALLGLATVAKYNALPLWMAAFIWVVWFARKKSVPTAKLLIYFLATLTGALLTAGWWFIFIWRNFNQIDALGLVQGSLTALTTGTADASLRQLGNASVSIPTLAEWPAWTTLLFQSFWGLFGGGSTIELSGWMYGLLAVISIIAIISLISYFVFCNLPTSSLPVSSTRSDQILHHSPFTIHHSPLFLLLPLLFLPLPILRYILSGQLVETAQGRHLFPALPLIALGLILGILYFTHYVLRITRSSTYTVIILPTLIFGLGLYSLYLITGSYPPRIPLQTAMPEAIQHSTKTELTNSITLLDYGFRGTPQANSLPIFLLWQTEAVPPEDYLIDLTLTDSSGTLIGNWVGHPVGGRYPTRAWDEGDIIRDTIDVPYLRTTLITDTTLTLTLLDSFNQPVTDSIDLFTLPALPHFQINSPTSPFSLRADNLPANAPFTYRSTLSFVLPDQSEPPALVAPNGQPFTPDFVLTTNDGLIAHFIVAPNWPSDDYQLSISNEPLTTNNSAVKIQPSKFKINNRAVQFEPPPMQHMTNANFANQVTLLGFDLPQQRIEPGQSFPITLHLRAERTLGKDLIIFNHLLDQNAVQRGGADRVPQKYYTTLLWVPGEVVSDAYSVPVNTDAPPGIYWLDVGLYPADDPAFSLPLVVDNQPIDRRSVSIGPIKVGGPPSDVTVTEAHPQTILNIPFGNQITLLGFNLTDPNGNPINPKPIVQNLKFKIQNSKLTLYWQANTIPDEDYTVFIHFVDAAGNVVAQADGPPAAGNYPTSLWDMGEIIVDERQLPSLPDGTYTIRAGLYHPNTGQRLAIPNSADGAVDLFELKTN